MHLLFSLLNILLIIGTARSKNCPPNCSCSEYMVTCAYSIAKVIPAIAYRPTILDLRFNLIGEVEKDKLKNQTRLVKLLLNNNRIQKIQDEAFDSLAKLQYLYLPNNRIQYLPEKIFSQLKKLKIISLQNNLLVSLPPKLFANQNMQFLKLDENPLTCACDTILSVALAKVSQFSGTCVDQSRKNFTIQSHLLTKFGCESSDNGNDNTLAQTNKTSETHRHIASFDVSPRLLKGLGEGVKNLNEGESLKLNCVAAGKPKPVISWFKNGNSLYHSTAVQKDFVPYIFEDNENGSSLTIEKLRVEDRGMYSCLAQNIHDAVKSFVELRVAPRFRVVPTILSRPFDIEVISSANVEIPCRVTGQPKPIVRWYRNNQPISTEPATLYPTDNTSWSASLRLNSVTLDHSGVYKCEVANLYGSASATASLIVTDNSLSEIEKLTVLAVKDARKDIRRAIDATVGQLFSEPGPKPPRTLVNMLRYPDEITRGIVEPSEVYQRTLQLIRQQVLAGIKFNPAKEATNEEVLTEAQIELVANLSGCVPQPAFVNCSDPLLAKYHSLDGTCNNEGRPRMGAAHTAFHRLLDPIYENGFSQPVGWNSDVKYHGFAKPLARLVSTTVIRTNDVTPNPDITHMLMQWGQFIDHDLSHSLPSTTVENWDGGLDCKKTCEFSEPCFPILTPLGDSRITSRRCMDFIRTSAVCGSGTTSVYWGTIQPRQQINQLTSYMDATQVYGFSRDRSFLLRDLQSDWGLLRGSSTSSAGKLYLPTAGITEVDCRRNIVESDIGCFLAGDIRVNEQVGLLAMHTLWLREHNRIAETLHTLNAAWDSEKLYYETRKIVIAQMQHITYKHWLPLVIGEEGTTLLGKYQAYDSTVDPSVSNEFATAALRFGHSIINPELARLNEDFKTIPQGNLSMGDAFFTPWRLVEEGGIDPLLRGMFHQNAKLKISDQTLNLQLTDKLFKTAHAVALDLAALNIQRGRDHGLPGYQDYRKYCNLSISETFENLQDITNDDVRKKLKKLYGHPGNIDIWVGGILEDTTKGSLVGPLFRCILIEQFKRTRDGDRFWYENPNVFSKEKFEEIRKSSLAMVICDNSDNITFISEDVFKMTRNYQKCDILPKMDLSAWKE